ncbi:GNAT family N-acetyltransferase [Halobacillus litoralis]|uniref:GNAT family N-acetyltransferase n=1 Tax=Halobacillus litoralis TaxID=45668 RepID=UPI001CFD2712|nr:GNAT family N-acetyltransferase [Halobacillus litoralis]
MVRLQPMNRNEFEKFYEASITNYANEKVLAGNWKEEESVEKSKEEFSNLLPEGRGTKNHYLYTIVNDQGENIGVIWLARETDEKGFIYDINIDKEHQGCGHGEKAMRRMEEEAGRLGMKKIGLHVFGHNTVARSLYEKLGYQKTNIVMEKFI